MVTLDSISIDGIKDLHKINLTLDNPYFYNLEVYVKYSSREDEYGLYSLSITNPKGIMMESNKNKEISFIYSKILIFNSDMDYDSLFFSLSKLIIDSSGRDIYETSILLQRYFEEQDVMFGSQKDYYNYLFDKIKKIDDNTL